jgi:hypothetical protein
MLADAQLTEGASCRDAGWSAAAIRQLHDDGVIHCMRQNMGVATAPVVG